MAWGMFGFLLVLVLLGMPIALAVGSIILFYIWAIGDVPLIIIPQQTIGAIDSFLLLAVPMFLLTGQLMGDADASRRLVRFSQSLVGWVRGGVGQVNVLTNLFMAGISGSALADAAATGSALVPIMKRAGYGAAFSAALTASAACIGPIVPPSIIMVLIGGLTTVSIGRMFLGGIVPGILLALAFGVVVYVTARRRNIPRSDAFSAREVLVSFWGALPSIGLPAIIIGGILSGVFTPTESAGIAAVYTILLGVVYRKLSWRVFYRTVVDVGVTTAAIMFVVGVSGTFGWILASQSIGQYIVDGLVGITNDKTLMLLIIAGVLLVLGCVLETLPTLVLAVPVLMPLVVQIGIDPVQFGVVAAVALATGLIIPPFGLVMFLMCRMAGVKMGEFAREVIPFLAVMIGAMVLLVVFPELILWVPNHVLGSSP